MAPASRGEPFCPDATRLCAGHANELALDPLTREPDHALLQLGSALVLQQSLTHRDGGQYREVDLHLATDRDVSHRLLVWVRVAKDR